MSVGNNSPNRLAGSGQSRIIKTGETYTGPVSHFVPREDSEISELEESVIFNGTDTAISVIGTTITLPDGGSEDGQNMSGSTLYAGEIFVPRYGKFTKIVVSSGSVVAYLLLSPKQVNRKLD